MITSPVGPLNDRRLSRLDVQQIVEIRAHAGVQTPRARSVRNAVVPESHSNRPDKNRPASGRSNSQPRKAPSRRPAS